MTNQEAIDLLYELIGLTKEKSADGVATAQALLSNVNASEQAAMNARQNQAAINAYWKSQCGDSYTEPEEDMGSNFVNCSIVSDKAISQLAQVIGDGGETDPVPPPTQPPTQPPANDKPKWWRVVLSTLGAVLLGAILVWLSWKAFGNPPRYEIIAEPFEPPELLDIQR